MYAHALPESLGDQWQFWGPLRETTRLAEPTAGHLALAEWQQRRVREGAEVTLVTANVDNLHERAGSDPVHHIHGRLGSSVCMVPDCSGRLDDDRHSDGTPTPCPECGGSDAARGRAVRRAGGRGRPVGGEARGAQL